MDGIIPNLPRKFCLGAALLFLSLGKAAWSDGHEVFYDVWGTEKQCARAPIKSGGTVLAEPIEIGPIWLKQGDLWCGLSWGPVEKSENGLFTIANAKCGEDSILDYLLGFKLVGDQLTLRWEVTLSNGPLMRCRTP